MKFTVGQSYGPTVNIPFRWRSINRAAYSAVAFGLNNNNTLTDKLNDASTNVSRRNMASTDQTHLVLCVNGLFGSPANWTVMRELLHEHLDSTSTLIHVSSVNQFRATYQGIDVCGDRLAEELKSIVLERPHLQRLTIVAHSMGGLISRYAIGRLFDEEKKTVAGLEPSHFMALATPHAGVCPEPGVGEVPLIGWMGNVPALGSGIQWIAKAVAPTISAVSFNRSGQQFFLRDGDSGGLPLLTRLAHDTSEGKFYSALAAFSTRTCYGNATGDHLVNWAQSTVRHVTELPTVPKGKGVVREDPLLEAWHPNERAVLQQLPIAAELHARDSLESQAQNILRATSPEDLVARDIVQNSDVSGERHATPSTTSTSDRHEPRAMRVNSFTASPHQLIEDNLRQLQSLNWRRVDVCFRKTKLPLLAHQHMQVQRKWLNWDGSATAKHVVLQLKAMEEVELAKKGAV